VANYSFLCSSLYFPERLCSILLSGWLRITYSSTLLWFSQQFSCRLTRWMALWISSSSGRRWLSRCLVHHIAQLMVADCSFYCSSMAFPMVRVQYCTADGSGLLIVPLLNMFRDGLRAASVHQQLSQRFARCFPQQMSLLCSFLHLSTAFTVCMLYLSAESCTLLIHLLVDTFHHLCTVFLCRWPQVAHTSASQRLSWFAQCIALRIAADCSFFHSLMAFTMVCIPFCPMMTV